MYAGGAVLSAPPAAPREEAAMKSRGAKHHQYRPGDEVLIKMRDGSRFTAG